MEARAEALGRGEAYRAMPAEVVEKVPMEDTRVLTVAVLDMKRRRPESVNHVFPKPSPTMLLGSVKVAAPPWPLAKPLAVTEPATALTKPVEFTMRMAAPGPPVWDTSRVLLKKSERPLGSLKAAAVPCPSTRAAAPLPTYTPMAHTTPPEVAV